MPTTDTDTTAPATCTWLDCTREYTLQAGLCQLHRAGLARRGDQAKWDRVRANDAYVAAKYGR